MSSMGYCEDPCVYDLARTTKALGLILRGFLLYLQGNPEEGLKEINEGIALADSVIEDNSVK